MSALKRIWVLAAWIGLACLRVGVAQPEPGWAQLEAVALESGPAVQVREPTLRKIHPQKDAAVAARIEFQREKLPEQYQRRNNFAWAVAKIKGLDKAEYFAHSGIQSLDDFSKEAARQVAGISLRPGTGRYHVLCVNQNDVVEGPDCWPRSVDTEYKILEDLVARLPDTAAKGRVKLYTDLPPCASCWNVMKQFLAEYTNVQMQVLYRKK